MFTSSTKSEITHSHNAESCSGDLEKRDARAELFFCQSKPIAFLPFSLRSPSSLLKPSYDNAARKLGRGTSILLAVVFYDDKRNGFVADLGPRGEVVACYKAFLNVKPISLFKLVRLPAHWILQTAPIW